MKYLILTDTHLAEGNMKVTKSLYKEAATLCKKHNCDSIIHAGDVFESRKSLTYSVLRCFMEACQTLKEEGVKMHIIPGNHDKTNYSSADSYIDIFSRYEAIEVHKNGKVLLDDGSKSRVFLMPYFDEENGTYAEKLNLLASNKKVGANDTLITHVGINGAKMNNSKSCSDCTPKEMFDMFGQVLVGHFHDETQMGNIHYIGATIQHNFGEEDGKGFLLFDSDTGGKKRIPATYPSYKTVNIAAHELNKSMQLSIIASKEKSSNVRVRLSGLDADLMSFDKKELEDAGIKVEFADYRVEADMQKAEIGEFKIQSSEDILNEFPIFLSEQEITDVGEIEYGTKKLNVVCG